MIFKLGTAVLLASLGAACTDDLDATSTERATQPTPTVELGVAGKFVILSKSGISTVPPTDITGNIGVSPIAASAITGFSLNADATNVFSTSSQVTGRVYAADFVSPTPAGMTSAVSDMETAFVDAAGRAPGVTELGAGDIGGMTISPGVYAWSSAVLMPTSITLKGTSTDIWIFQIAQGLDLSTNAAVTLTGGAEAKNVFWQVSEGVNLGSAAHLEGVVLAGTAITLGSTASVNGRLLSQTAVTLINNTIVGP